MKSSIVLYNLVVIGITASVYAQPDTLWTQAYGGASYENGFSVQQTADNGFIVAGYTESFGAGADDVYLIKTDLSGNEQWYQTYGGSAIDRAYSVQQTTDGGYIISGRTESFGSGGYDVYLIKTDTSGVEEWFQTYGGSSFDRGNTIQQTSDGGYAIVGRTYSFGSGLCDFYLIKTNSDGDEQWFQTYGGSDSEDGRCFQQTSDSGYIIVGDTQSYGAGYSDAYLVKTDSSGIVLWDQTFGGTNWDYGTSVQQTTDGGYIVTGYTWSDTPGQGHDITLTKTDSSGTVVWTQTYTGITDDYAYCVKQTLEGGYIVAGYTTDPYTGNRDVYLIKTDASGSISWTQTYGGSSNDYSRSVQQTSEGGYILAGRTDSYGAGDADVWLIRLNSETSIEPEIGMPQQYNYSLMPANPNPVNHMTSIAYTIPVAGNVSLSVYDISGRTVSTPVNRRNSAGVHEATFDVSDLCPGVYFYRISVNNFTATGKLIVIR